VESEIPTAFCATKDDLLRKYNHAMLKWTQLANEFLSVTETGTVTPALSRAIEAAHKESDQARMPYENHIAEHGLLT
jgi:hypothetical protein